MSEEDSSSGRTKPKHVLELEKLKFSDPVLEKSKIKLVTAINTILSPISTKWVRMKKHSEELKEQAQDEIFNICSWPKVAEVYIEEVEDYNYLKSEESRMFSEFIVEFADRLRQMDLERNQQGESWSVDSIMQRAKEILENQPKIQLKMESGKKSLQSELSKECGIEYKDQIEEVIIKLEGEKHG